MLRELGKLCQLLPSLKELIPNNLPVTPGAAIRHSSTGVKETAFNDPLVCYTTPLALHLPGSVKEKIVKGE